MDAARNARKRAVVAGGRTEARLETGARTGAGTTREAGAAGREQR